MVTQLFPNGSQAHLPKDPSTCETHPKGDQCGSCSSQEVTTFNPLVLLPVEARAGL